MGSNGPRSPPSFLQRSRSGTSRRRHVDPPETPPFSPNRVSTAVALSKSTSKARDRKPKENRQNCLSADTKRTRKGWSTVPSAWALSPGRSPEVANFRPDSNGGAKRRVMGGGGGSSVFGFFRQRKVPSAREEEIHQLRLLWSKLVQWRFVNARGEAAIEGCKLTAEKKLSYMWTRNGEMRKIVAAKRILIQRLKHQLKLGQILKPQVQLLDHWDHTTNKRSLEVLADYTRVVEAASVNVPLVEGSKADIVRVGRSITMAMNVMTEIESAILRFFSKVENLNLLLNELVRTQKLEMEGLQELIKTARIVASLEINAISLRANLVQVTKDEKLMPLNIPNLALSTMKIY